ncbi:hypothetical protein [Dickeya zeae]|uniref:Uncharacterized protein n=1 Tax=Dickeya zeae TaxID=204042 RepID=A0AAE6Z2P9_9GAMM|nr:hypothetical protein [Dickeya zeae]QIZ52368.1 hypothetical protein DWG24_17250 [Dickeya zeae]QYM92251.1 hypothetical protein FGI21_10365 [Dickeya zeae]
MCINIVISNKSLNEWNWRAINENGETVAASPHIFENRPLCIKNAEAFLDLIPDAKIYDFAGVPIDPMHLSNTAHAAVRGTIKTTPAK